MYKILSIDGGGIRGIIAVRILEMLERHHPDIVQEFDLFADLVDLDPLLDWIGDRF